MNVNEAKATSRLLHSLAGDTELDPVTAAAVIETLSFQAGAALEIARVLPPASLQVAVETATTHARAGCLDAEGASSTHETTTTVTTHSGAWRLLAGALIAIMAVLMSAATLIGNGWLLLSGPLVGFAAVLASQQADRELQRLFHAVEAHPRSGALESELALAQPASVDEQPTATGGH